MTGKGRELVLLPAPLVAAAASRGSVVDYLSGKLLASFLCGAILPVSHGSLMAFVVLFPGFRKREFVPRLPRATCRMSNPPRLSRRALLAVAAAIPAGVTMAANADGEDSKAKSWWPPKTMKKGFAQGMENGMGDYELAVSNRKRKLFENLTTSGGGLKVLDVGIGTGPNLVYLPSNISCIGLDPNPFMFKYAEKKAEGLITRGLSLKLLEGDAESIPCDDDCFDAVISTLTLCSVKNPKRALSEIWRVLKPGGAFLFIEHVCAKDTPVLRTAQSILNPLQVLVADNCHLTRDTGKLIRNADGFQSVEIENFTVDLGLSGALISHQICGKAIKA